MKLVEQFAPDTCVLEGEDGFRIYLTNPAHDGKFWITRAARLGAELVVVEDRGHLYACSMDAFQSQQSPSFAELPHLMTWSEYCDAFTG